MRTIDCQCFAGGLTWSFVHEGFELVGKREHPGGFGVDMCEGNRHLLGDEWETQACMPSQWDPKPVEVVIGNPPCSGFSTLNTSKNRGIDAPINQCMKDYISFAAKCKPAIIVMESVQQAYTGGRELMLKLRALAEEQSGFKYDVFHALHSVAALGGSQIRRRYFLVLHRIPFGIDEREVVQCKTGLSFIEDLMGKELSWDGYPDGHTVGETNRCRRVNKLLKVEPWAQGERIGAPLDRAFEKKVDLESMGWGISTIISSVADDCLGGPHATSRVIGDKLWPVITGASMSQQVHPIEDRTITYREAARLMGFPDDWSVLPCRGHKDGHKWFGKGVTTFAGRWMARLARNAVSGQPSPVLGDEIGDRERVANITNLFVKPNHQNGDDDEGE